VNDFITTPSTPSKVFNSAQALGRARSQIKRQLSRSPRKKAAVHSNEPATEMGLMPQRTSSSGGHNALSNETVECVKKFFL